MNDGPSWKEHRSFVSQGFRKYGLGNSTIEQRIQYVVDEFLQQIDVSYEQKDERSQFSKLNQEACKYIENS